MAGQEMHVRWRHHQAGLLSYLRQMLTSEVFVDVTICCQNKRLKAHRVLLSACSPYLQDLLMAHPTSDHATIILHDVTYEDMRALLDFVYTGGVTVPEHRLPSFLEAAHTLQITVLTDKSLHQQVPSRLCDKNIPALIKVHQDRPYFFQQPYKDTCIPNRNGFKTEFTMIESVEHEQLTNMLSEQKPVIDDNNYKVKPELRTPLRENDFMSENSPKEFNNLGSPVAEYRSFIHSPRHLSPVPRLDSNISSLNKYDTSSSGSSPSPDTMDFQWVRPLPSLMPISASTALHQRRLGVPTQKHPRKSLGGILTPSPWSQNGRPPVGAPRVIRSPGRGTEKSASGEESDHLEGKSSLSPNYHQMEANGALPGSPILHETCSRSDGDSSCEPPSLPRENDENRPHVNSDPTAEVTRLKERRLQDFYRDQLLSNGQGPIGELPFKPPLLLDKIHRYSEQPFFPVNKLHHISRILNVENGSEVNPLHGMKTLANLLEDSNSGVSTIPRRKSLSCSDLTDDTEPTVNDSNNNEGEGAGHRCDECGKVCNSLQQLALHRQSPECLACGVCGKQFSQRAQWTAHQRQHEETRQEHACNHCTKTFVTRASLKVHMRTHTGEKPFHCLECGKQFSQLRNYKYHRSVHEGTREFAATCPECGKYFNDRGYLSSHMKIHRNRKEYGCEFCGKSFNQRVAYNMHVRIHTGEKPHSCPHCAKSFSRKMLLKQHLRIHTGEKPFTCVVCQKAFADRSNMTLHMRLHSGVKPYTCSVCSKSFTKKHHLKTHMNYHTGVKPYSCSKCGLRFSQSSNMRTHFKKCSSSPLNNTEHDSNPNSVAPIDMTMAPPVPTPTNSDESSSVTNTTQDNIR